MTPVLPPGTILQHLYLQERLRRQPAGRFVEVGTGEGHLTRLLTGLGWAGASYDLSAEAVKRASLLLAPAIAARKLEVHQGDWLNQGPGGEVDLVISSMVLEHLPDAREARYFERCREVLAPGGMAALFVPASMKHWGIEDDIAGHLRRYTAAGLAARLEELGWRVDHWAGLTYPLSNWLLPLSNVLVGANERPKLALDVQERTERSGHREVPFKTHFPPLLGLVLNGTTLYPWHLLQKATLAHPDAMVLYAECRPN